VYLPPWQCEGQTSAQVNMHDRGSVDGNGSLHGRTRTLPADRRSCDAGPVKRPVRCLSTSSCTDLC